MPTKIPTDLPRFDRPLDERIAFALAWYRDGVVIPDIAAATVLTHMGVSIAALAAGLPRRPRRAVTNVPGKRLAAILRAARVETDAEVGRRFELSPAGLQAVRALLVDNTPRAIRGPARFSDEEAPVLRRRCPACLRTIETAAATSPCCGVPW